MKCFYMFKKDNTKTKQEKPLEIISKVKPRRVISSPRSVIEMYKEKEHNLRVFSFEELRYATRNFNRLLKIGEGGFGSVYKGCIRLDDGVADPSVVAVKALKKNGLQGHKQWLAEVQFLGIVEHPNLVKLLGYCSEDGERGIRRLLVYEYMPNKSLEDHIFSRALPTLPWKRRLHIMLGAAQGLAYLHNELDVQVIYRDFKSSNVLLDVEFMPKLSDFGLAREGPTGDKSHVSTEPVGTYGYAAPEYIQTGRLATHCDVWSFGVVLYEILTGRRVLERHRSRNEQKLLDWVKQFPSDSKRFGMIIDPRIRNHYSISAARKMAKLADSCMIKNPKDRPTMDEVVESLKQIVEESEETNLIRIFLSTTTVQMKIKEIMSKNSMGIGNWPRPVYSPLFHSGMVSCLGENLLVKNSVI
ncbi:putative serine/threonine-protein kinase PBL19 [Heracleum sosnowskyi]|uniref:non-specific serine/threonine protein kinase n=1 Tax=Heracleum sosnowskyi TaxID=360622 RepID=A0AAD8GYS6_9APIA|nr:putative serine/threonine-protein kinase PBL19 [Heracleum sosnowskyi]